MNVLVLSTDPLGGPIASECSGGDLDGDLYSLIWDDRLVPHDTWPPLDHDAVRAKARQRQGEGGEGAPDSLEEALIKGMDNDMLGRIARLHLALCDAADDGARGPSAIALAEEFALAVGGVKTGLTAHIPADAAAKVAGRGYPDFMEPVGGGGYRSQKLLGRLYQRCMAVMATEGEGGGGEKVGCTLRAAAVREGVREWCETQGHTGMEDLLAEAQVGPPHSERERERDDIGADRRGRCIGDIMCVRER